MGKGTKEGGPAWDTAWRRGSEWRPDAQAVEPGHDRAVRQRRTGEAYRGPEQWRVGRARRAWAGRGRREMGRAHEEQYSSQFIQNISKRLKLI
jgi:hypothetical protein